MPDLKTLNEKLIRAAPRPTSPLSLSLTHALSLTLSHSHTHTHSLSLSLTHTHIHTQLRTHDTLTQTIFVDETNFLHTLSHSLIYTHPHNLTTSFSLSLPLSLSLFIIPCCLLAYSSYFVISFKTIFLLYLFHRPLSKANLKLK